jgi:hypothetical protein
MSEADFKVEARGDTIVVTDPIRQFFAIYMKPADARQLVLKSYDVTKSYELLAQAWAVADDKARELGLIARLSLPLRFFHWGFGIGEVRPFEQQGEHGDPQLRCSSSYRSTNSGPVFKAASRRRAHTLPIACRSYIANPRRRSMRRDE